MIIVYQIRSMEHTRKHYPDLACPAANGGGTGVTIAVLQRYLWFFGPMMPTLKFGVAFCDNGERIPASKWTPEITAKYKELKAGTRTPLRLWRGMIVIPSFILVLALFARIAKFKKDRSDKEVAGYVADPKPGDIYYANNGGTLVIDGNSATSTNDVYALYKVKDIQGDSIFVIPGNASRIGTAEKPVNPYTSGFWEDLEKETTTFNATPVIISLKSLHQYNYFFMLPRDAQSSPGRVYNVTRAEK
ncbi:MAG: hypothetical protein J7623_07020 [Chitinophaga sp.]|uniref:hypothetical protein n=1 Tax=Chitinophaga sp. TaxID=1869181 RepID=UPI001AFEED65|nr:hypothetical protein [Chitinophaga sp.]MBO9728375.1 hypothetical protein [Chitinophaga sp.]